MATLIHQFGLMACLGSAICLWPASATAQDVPSALIGDWSLQLQSKTPAWLSVQQHDGKPVVYFRRYVGSAGPYREVAVNKGRLQFVMKKKRKATAEPATVEFGITDGQLDGVIRRLQPDGSIKRDLFSGKKIPPMPLVAPDLSKVVFGPPIRLFNGKDLSGWTPHESDKLNGWSVVDGVMKNATPKTDFSATGAYANLKTEAVFSDFRLHIEFLVEAKRNSGIYLRGMYEAQVVDRDSPMQGIQGPGAIFGAIAPSENAGKPGGEWQSYDITLVDRHVTVVLNGKTVIDHQPIAGPTAGAIHTNPASPGPIYLQGDHTAVSYRNVYLEPVLPER